MRTRSTKRLTTSITLAIALTCFLAPNSLAQSGEWEHALAIYGWLPTIEGTLAYEVPGIGDSIEVDPDALLDNLQFAALATFAAKHDDWSVLADVIYLKEAQTRNRTIDLGGGINVKTDIELKSWVVNFAGGYEVARNDRSDLSVLLGVRYFYADSRLSLKGDGPLGTDVSADSSSTVWNGVVGITGRLGLSERWSIPYYLDLGAGDSDLTWQGMAGLGYDFDWGGVILGYRYLDFDQGPDEGVSELVMRGAELGVVFRF